MGVDVRGLFLWTPGIIRGHPMHSYTLPSISLRQLLGKNADLGCPCLHVQIVENNLNNFFRFQLTFS